MKLKTESVKISTHTLNKVRKHVKKSKQSIGGFFELAAADKLKKDSVVELVGNVITQPKD